jgi:hypothetical protein
VTAYKAKRWPLLLVLMALVSTGCVNQTVKSTSVPAVQTSERNLPEAQLLDLGVVIFDPGLDVDGDEDELVYPEVRQAEARYMPYLLSEAIQSSASWGAVRVVPDEKQAMDVIVSATIIQSDGEVLTLYVQARDATGRVWINQQYKAKASKYSYQASTRSRFDPFQAIYNRIANDLLKAEQALQPEQLSEIRLVNELRFARSFAPGAFEGHLNEPGDGTYTIARLPAADDPMLIRVRKIRERDYLFIDTLQEYYSSFNGQMIDPYQEWRRQSYEEAIALRELKAESTRRLIGGIAMVVAGIAAAGSNDSSSRAAANVAIAGGGYLVKSGLDKRTESEIHVQALEELGMSLQAEITPQIIELEDRSVTLTGNVNDQYEQWRELLQQIYEAEVGALPAPQEGGET